MAIQITETALKEIKKIVEARDDLKEGVNRDITFLRMGVKGGGCSGFSYALELDNEPQPHDRTFEFAFPDAKEGDPKLKVAVDAKSYLYLNGTTLDYVAAGLVGGFEFTNPNAKSTCGCGTSFSA